MVPPSFDGDQVRTLVKQVVRSPRIEGLMIDGGGGGLAVVLVRAIDEEAGE